MVILVSSMQLRMLSVKGKKGIVWSLAVGHNSKLLVA